MRGISDTSTETYRQLMGNGLRYEIPKFQRDYSWDYEQWDDLWLDIEALESGQEVEHYMGYLVLQTSDNKNFQVIDGQQRLTTLGLIVLAVIKSLKDFVEKGSETKDNEARIESFQNSYIGSVDPVSLVSFNKLKLNYNNDSYYRNYMVSFQELPNRGINSSERLMRNCFLWYYERIKNKHKSGEELALFVDKLVDKLFFTVIKVTDDLNAFKVFETLNARAVQLSAADLLKNYLFYIVDASSPHQNELLELENFWVKITGKLGSNNLPEFLRIYWNSKNRTVRKNDLFKTIRSTITNKEQVFLLVRELDNYVDIYMAIQNPDDEFWEGNSTIRLHLRELKIFQIKQPFSLLLAAYKELNTNEFIKVLKACSIISFRYNIIGGFNPNEQEKVYNSVALQIREHKHFENTMLRDVYPNDGSFLTEFSLKTFKDTTRNNRIVRYIMGKLEKNIYRVDIDHNSEALSIEHVLPENANEDWEMNRDEIEQNKYRLGNLTLLEKDLNKEADGKVFPIKKDFFLRSAVNLTKAIAERNLEWNAEKIASRQRYLAEQAKSIWRLEM